MKMKKLNIYIIGLLTLMLCGIQSCALESEAVSYTHLTLPTT